MARHRKSVSMQTIADELNISKNAVSLALSGKAGVSEDVRKLVVATAERMGYLAAKSSAKNEMYILFVVDEFIQFHDGFYYPIFSEVMNYAHQQGYQVLISGVTREMQKDLALPNIIYEFPVCGVLSMGLLNDAYLQKIMDLNFPLVMLVNQVMNIETDFVLSDNVQGAFQIVNHLISMGHRKIGYISYLYSYRSFYQRWQGYQIAMHTAGLPIVPEHSIVTEINYSPTIHPGDSRPLTSDEISAFVDKMLTLENGPTAWLCGNDALAVSLINECQRRNISVPDEISFAGFDGTEHASIVRPTLTTMDTKRDVLSRQAVDLLIKHINHPEQWHPVTVSVICELVQGDSVKDLQQN
ncbi:LacI family DNA-binding transcriptional regulator [Paenibacillus sp. NPDC058174]|uniref:LacI family DNA-binding transcriptional regulator n=1 Tax=Paenibacillus sp. NPDC058174 TaxID=3346366 RepID=UPI0036DADCB0